MTFRSTQIIFAASVVALLAMPLARACFVCKAAPMESVLVAEIEGSEDVVLARPSPSGQKDQFQIVKVFEGKEAPGTEVAALLPTFSEDGRKMGGGVVLVTRRDVKAGWIIRAPALFHQVAFYERILSLPPRVAKETVDQARRVAFFVNYLHHEDPVLAKAAAAEVAEAPYAVLKMVKKNLDGQSIRAELKKIEVRNRRALFYTLLGLCGDPGDAVGLNKTLDAMWKTNGFTNLAALITAKLEIEGQAAVDEIETRYFRDRDRTYPEVEAAILALRLHGNADHMVPRDRVIEAYRNLLIDREPMAFLVAGDLARWGDWESKERLVAIAEKRGGDLPEIRLRVNEYLEVCPK